MARAAKPDDMPEIVDLMFPTLEALKALGGSGQVGEIDNHIADALGLSNAALYHRDLKANKLLFNWKCAWARTHLKAGGGLENTKRGVWAITPTGRALQRKQMRQIMSDAHRDARQRRLAKDQPGDEDEETTEQSWEDELLAVLQAMAPDAFERLAQRILRESNFSKVEVTGKSGDGGIDGVGVLQIELISFQVFFQCKRYKDTVGAGTLRDFRGAMVGRSDKGILITTGRFTADAKREATRDGAPPIDLIDGSDLCRLLKKLELGVKTQVVEEVEIEPAFFEGI